jgi:hypothetical protein
MSGHNAKSKVSTYLPVPQTPLKPGALVYLDDGGIQREYWQPGDGDGVADSEFPNKPLFKERYRFFQTDIGPIERGINSPPHYVALDDKAVWDIVSIKKYTVKERAAYWPFDFMANGVLRANRRHKGRAAEFAADYEGDEPMPWITAGPKNNSIKYYLSGQPGGYEEIVFNSSTSKPGPAKHTTTSTGGRKTGSQTKTGNQTKIPTAEATSNLNNGSKTEYATKRKADEPLNPRHDRPKVGKYLHSTPSPEWPGGVRRLNKPPVARAGADDRNNVNPPDGSEWSPSARVGGKTVYAHYDYGGEAPERSGGRVVASGAQTSYARTPYADGAKTPYQQSTFGAKTPGPQAPIPAPMSSHDARAALPSQQPPSWDIVNMLREELRQTRQELQQIRQELQQTRRERQQERAERGQERAERRQEKAERQQEKAEREWEKVKFAQIKGVLRKYDEGI